MPDQTDSTTETKAPTAGKPIPQDAILQVRLRYHADSMQSASDARVNPFAITLIAECLGDRDELLNGGMFFSFPFDHKGRPVWCIVTADAPNILGLTPAADSDALRLLDTVPVPVGVSEDLTRERNRLETLQALIADRDRLQAEQDAPTFLSARVKALRQTLELIQEITAENKPPSERLSHINEVIDYALEQLQGAGASTGNPTKAEVEAA